METKSLVTQILKATKQTAFNWQDYLAYTQPFSFETRSHTKQNESC